MAVRKIRWPAPNGTVEQRASVRRNGAGNLQEILIDAVCLPPGFGRRPGPRSITSICRKIAPDQSLNVKVSLMREGGDAVDALHKLTAVNNLPGPKVIQHPRDTTPVGQLRPCPHADMCVPKRRATLVRALNRVSRPEIEPAEEEEFSLTLPIMRNEAQHRRRQTAPGRQLIADPNLLIRGWQRRLPEIRHTAGLRDCRKQLVHVIRRIRRCQLRRLSYVGRGCNKGG